MPAPSAKPWIYDLAPYVPGKAKADGVVHPIKLSANESVIGPSPKAIEAYRSLPLGLERYPDPESQDLRAALADVHGLDLSKIMCGAGSDELITLLIQVYAGPGDEVIHSEVGFSFYAIQAKAVGATPVAIPNKDWAANVDGILAAVTDTTKMVFVDNPNNPSGAYISGRELNRLHAGLPEDVLLVVDSAYAECAIADDYEDGSAMVEAHQNVVMTRTLSKLYGLAGLRVGWAYAPEAVLDCLNRIRMPFNVGVGSQIAALEAIKDQDFLKEVVAFTAQEREVLTAGFSAMGLTVIPSQTNFVLVEFPAEAPNRAQDVYAYLMQQGYLVRYFKTERLAGHLRISVGLAEHNRAVLELVRAYMDGGHQ